MAESTLNIDRILDAAERDYLLNGTLDHMIDVPARMRATIEQELSKYPFLKIRKYCDSREGKLWVGRPKELGLDSEALRRLRPQLEQVRGYWRQAEDIIGNRVPWQAFLRSNYAECRKKAPLLPTLARVLKYLCEHEDEIVAQGLYPRQIPHGQSTKLIGHEGLLLRLYAALTGEADCTWEDLFSRYKLKKKPIGYQFFADKIRWRGTLVEDIRGIVDSDNVSDWGLQDIAKLLIVENEESFHPLRGLLSDTVVVFGEGRMANCLGFLASHLLPCTRIYYWGDIDKAGYEVLSSVSEVLPPLKPVCMDVTFIERYWDLRQPSLVAEPSPRGVRVLDNEYNRVCREGFQIEQEQIALDDLLPQIV